MQNHFFQISLFSVNECINLASFYDLKFPRFSMKRCILFPTGCKLCKQDWKDYSQLIMVITFQLLYICSFLQEDGGEKRKFMDRLVWSNNQFFLLLFLFSFFFLWKLQNKTIDRYGAQYLRVDSNLSSCAVKSMTSPEASSGGQQRQKLKSGILFRGTGKPNSSQVKDSFSSAYKDLSDD